MMCACTEIGLVNGMVKCVNTKMGRTPTGSGCLRLVIMHNLKNEEERKGKEIFSREVQNVKSSCWECWQEVIGWDRAYWKMSDREISSIRVVSAMYHQRYLYTPL